MGQRHCPSRWSCRSEWREQRAETTRARRAPTQSTKMGRRAVENGNAMGERKTGDLETTRRKNKEHWGFGLSGAESNLIQVCVPHYMEGNNRQGKMGGLWRLRFIHKGCRPLPSPSPQPRPSLDSKPSTTASNIASQCVGFLSLLGTLFILLISWKGRWAKVLDRYALLLYNSEIKADKET